MTATVSVSLIATYDYDDEVDTHEQEQKQKHRIRLGAASVNGLILDNGVAGVVSRIVKTEGREVEVEEGEEEENIGCKALIDTREGCLRLEARSDEIYVSPLYQLDLCAENDEEKKRQRSGWLHVQRSTTECKYTVFLRPGDSIRLGPAAPCFTVEVNNLRPLPSTTNNIDAVRYSPQNTVQVNSSQPDGHPSKPIRTASNDHNQGHSLGEQAKKENEKEEAAEQSSSSNAHEVAESMKGPDILVDRSTTFTESLLRSTSTPRASIAQSEKIEDTPAVEGGRYYDASGVGALGMATMMTTTATSNTAEIADGGAGSGYDAVEVRKDEEQEGEAVINGTDIKEGSPAFYTPMPSMSTTISPEGKAKRVQNNVKDLPMSPNVIGTKNHSQRDRRRSMTKLASDNVMADAQRQLLGVKAEYPSIKPKEETGIDANQLPTISESPDVMSSSPVDNSRLKKVQNGEDEKVEDADGLQKSYVEKTELNGIEEKGQVTPANKRKASEKEAKPSRKRSKTTVSHEQQNNKENEFPPENSEPVSPPSKTLSAISPSVTREARSSITKTASPTSRKYRPYNGPGFNVAFSNSAVTSKPSLVRFLQSKGCSVVDRVSDKDTDILCIGYGEIKKTSKLLLALAYGKTIITDDWVTKSSRTGNLLDPNDFIPRYNPDSQADPSTSFSSSSPSPFAHIPVSTTTATNVNNNKSRKTLLAGKSVYFTPALKRDYSKGFVDIQEIVMAVGAKGVVSMPARDITPGPHYIVLALENGDLDAPILVDKGAVCYCKDLVTTSILRGKLELDSGEFRIVGSKEEENEAVRKSNDFNNNNKEKGGKLKTKKGKGSWR